MSLVAYTITALERDTADADASGKQIIVGATCSMFIQPADTAVLLYDDAAGSNGSTAKTTGANGQVTVYVDPGAYRVRVNGSDSFIVLNANEDPSFTGDLISDTFSARLGVINLDDNGSNNGIINAPASLFINIDSDNTATNEKIVIGKNRSGTGGGDDLVTINEDGNVLVGKTSTTFNTVGAVISQSGIGNFTADNNLPFAVNRLSTDGGVAGFYRDGVAVGSIGYTQSGINFHSTGCGIKATTNTITPTSGTGTNINGAVDLGASAVRFRQLFVTTATSVVSDRNKKATIEGLDAAELRVAQKAKSLLKKYRMKDRYEEEGEDARWHVGIIAQDLEQAFIDEGLDARRYSMFGADMNEETGEEELSIRYSELLAFIIGAL